MRRSTSSDPRGASPCGFFLVACLAEMEHTHAHESEWGAYGCVCVCACVIHLLNDGFALAERARLERVHQLHEVRALQ
jgi:hypothetical protein